VRPAPFILFTIQGLTPKYKRLGVRRMYPKAIADEDNIKPYLADKEASTPGASKIAQNILTLPTHKGINGNLAKSIAYKLKTT
jgi:dTDP-4-amino-4,6-dideoxygalactose transaminase